jgi:hypothetical protein
LFKALGKLIWDILPGYRNLDFFPFRISGIFFPDIGILIFFHPGSRIRDPGRKKIQSQDPGSGLNIPDLIFETLIPGIRFLGSKYLKSLMGSEILSTLDPGFVMERIKSEVLDPG